MTINLVGDSFGIVLSCLRSNACHLKLVPNPSPCHRRICAGRRRSDVLTRVGRQLIETVALNKCSGRPDRAALRLPTTVGRRRERFVLPSVARFSTGGGEPMVTEARETGSLIGSDKVEGTAVYGADDTKIGSIERVMIDKMSGKISYAS
jgi:hypothetical protein